MCVCLFIFGTLLTHKRILLSNILGFRGLGMVNDEHQYKRGDLGTL